MAHSEHQLQLPMRTEDDADPAVANVLATAKAGIGMIPNMYANMANAPGLLETYLTGYSAFRAESGFSPAEQETVFLTISRFNGCEYCMGAHSAIADMSEVPTEVTDAVRAGAPIADERLADQHLVDESHSSSLSKKLTNRRKAVVLRKTGRRTRP